MADAFNVRIVTPERTVYSERVTSIVVPGVDGYFGILAHHAPLLAELGIGCFKAVREDGKEDELAVAGGFLQVQDDVTTVLADSAERADEIDLRRAEEAAERARLRLADHNAQMDIPRAQAALQRAINRISIAGT